MDRFANFLQAVGYHSVLVRPLLPMYIHLILSALFPIYIGAHASLSRPSSAAKPSKRKKADQEEDEDEDEEDAEQQMTGLGPWDALILPLFAGSTLGVIYYIIKWLEDPATLNKILNWYCSVFGVFSLGYMLTDVMGVLNSFAFPAIYGGEEAGRVWMIDRKRRKARLVSKPSVERDWPMPSLSFLVRWLPSSWTRKLWALRELPSRKVTIRAYIHAFLRARVRLGPHDFACFFLAIVAELYFNLVDKPWWLTNLLGFSFAYTSLQVITPTTSWTGTMTLATLFIYDIYFVFFTPLMVTVATQLDIPAKLVFPRPSGPGDDPSEKNLSMLGLGDVVLPGMMIGFALRFDLYLFYLRKQTRKIAGKLVENNSASSKDVSEKENEADVVKPQWHIATGGWGERIWTPKAEILRSKRFKGSIFPKTYFYASLTGYVIGILCTLGVMQVYGHAQPALLYLVPGVLGALWGTALVKGDIKAMWAFNEAEEEQESEAKGNSGDSNWSPEEWKYVDWKSLFRFRKPFEKRKQIDGDLKEDIKGDTTNSRPRTPKRSRSSDDEEISEKASNGRLKKPKTSRSNGEDRKDNMSNKGSHQDHGTELIFFSITLPKSKVQAESEEHVAQWARAKSAKITNEEVKDDVLGETY